MTIRRPADLLEPAVQDHLPLLGVGLSGQVRGHGGWALKVAHPGEPYLSRIKAEIGTLRAWAATPPEGAAALGVPALLAVASDERAFVREAAPGPSLLEWMTGRFPGATDLPAFSAVRPRLLDPLLRAFRVTEAWRARTGRRLDFSPTNLFWSPAEGRFWIVDLGERLDPPRFADLDDAGELDRALDAYLAWRERAWGAGRVALPRMPPSGRFHVDTAVGPIPGARLLWVNRGALRRHRLALDDARLFDLANVATWSEAPTRVLPATRYQDARGKGPGFARGDGRAVRVGRLRELDLVAKGCGPTALVWAGNPYHEDGHVSFQRTLWEAAVCDELARLGFDTPEVLAIVPQTGRRTVDQTDVEWPAASALRASRSHWRLGHLVHLDDDPEALRAFLRFLVEEAALPAAFDPDRPGDVEQLVTRFARNLGEDTGRADGLNIQCFNPTMGNVRLDGHLLDFSTVRFMRHYVPDFVYMNGQRRVREVRSAHARHVGLLVDTLRKAGLAPAERGVALDVLGKRTYEAAYEHGYGRALCLYLGLDDADADDVPAPAWRALVDDLRRLRKLRAGERVAFAFWQQEVPAPLFDVEGRLPAFIDEVERDPDAAWAHLRSTFAGEVGPREAHVGRCLGRAFARVLASLPSERAPRRWSGIVRPFMECEALADLCYRRSTPDRFGAWQRAMASSRGLPEGRWSYPEARHEAHRLGHADKPGLGRAGYETVVGLYPELDEALGRWLRDLLDERLLGVVAFGPRVVPVERLAGEPAPPLVEGGADRRRATPLHLAVFTRPLGEEQGLVERYLGGATDRMQAPFPIGITLVETEAGGRPLVDLAHAWCAREGLDPGGVVRLVDPAGLPLDPRASTLRQLGRPTAAPGRQRVALDELAAPPAPPNRGPPSTLPVTAHQLEQCLRDDERCQPWPLRARREPSGALLLLHPEGGVLLEAARRAGRTALWVTVDDDEPGG